MTFKGFWNNAKVGVIGGGSWGTVLANIISRNCQEVRVWLRDEEVVRSINVTRTNKQFFPELRLDEKVHAYSSLERVFEGGLQAVIWALPSSACRDQAKVAARFFKGDELILHATKGVEPTTLKRMSEILAEELPCRRIGVISGPNLAAEVAKGEPAATVIASHFTEVLDAGQALLTSERFRTYRVTDVVGVEWAGVLKNILAIASGTIDSLGFGWNSRALLITRGLVEMVRFSVALGAKESTFLGLAGMGDLIATCCSPLSRNYRVGLKLGRGEKLEKILQELGSTAEGVGTAYCVREFAVRNQIPMPLTEGVYSLLKGEAPVAEIIHSLMTRPSLGD